MSTEDPTTSAEPKNKEVVVVHVDDDNDNDNDDDKKLPADNPASGVDVPPTNGTSNTTTTSGDSTPTGNLQAEKEGEPNPPSSSSFAPLPTEPGQMEDKTTATSTADAATAETVATITTPGSNKKRKALPKLPLQSNNRNLKQKSNNSNGGKRRGVGQPIIIEESIEKPTPKYYAIRKSGLLEGPAIFFTSKDVEFYVDPDEDEESAVEYRECATILEAMEFITRKRLLEMNVKNKPSDGTATTTATTTAVPNNASTFQPGTNNQNNNMPLGTTLPFPPPFLWPFSSPFSLLPPPPWISPPPINPMMNSASFPNNPFFPSTNPDPQANLTQFVSPTSQILPMPQRQPRQPTSVLPNLSATTAATSNTSKTTTMAAFPFSPLPPQPTPVVGEARNPNTTTMNPLFQQQIPMPTEVETEKSKRAAAKAASRALTKAANEALKVAKAGALRRPTPQQQQEQEVEEQHQQQVRMPEDGTNMAAAAAQILAATTGMDIANFTRKKRKRTTPAVECSDKDDDDDESEDVENDNDTNDADEIEKSGLSPRQGRRRKGRKKKQPKEPKPKKPKAPKPPKPKKISKLLTDPHWEERLEELKAFKAENGHCKVPYTSPRTELKKWVDKIRFHFQRFVQGLPTTVLTAEKVSLLTELGLELKVRVASKTPFEQRAFEWYQFKTQHGRDPKISDDPTKYAKHGMHLASWVNMVRKQYRSHLQGNTSSKGGLTQERIDRLNSWGFSWKPTVYNRLEDRINDWHEYKLALERDGKPYKDPEQGTPLHRFVAKLRSKYKQFQAGEKTNLTKEQMDQLTAWEFPWQSVNPSPKFTVTKFKSWQERYEELVEYKQQRGTIHVPIKYPVLGNWVMQQRKEWKKWAEGRKSCLNQDKVEKLERIGFVFSPRGPRQKRSMPTQEHPHEATLQNPLYPTILDGEQQSSSSSSNYDSDSDDSNDDDGDNEEHHHQQYHDGWC